MVALGKTMAGVIGNDDQLIAELTAIGEKAGELMWRLPLGPAQREQIKSEPADIVNSAGREAHPLQGGAFLSHFVPADGSVPWAHLDIAGVADTEKELPYYGKGATGWGVRTLVEWMHARSTASVPSAPAASESPCPVPEDEVGKMIKPTRSTARPTAKKITKPFAKRKQKS